jgi:dipeptidyl aminopeptidase/acylaminoacyl peptidase
MITLPTTILPTATPKATITPTLPVNKEPKVECLEVLPAIPKDAGLTGILVLGKLHGKGYPQLLDMEKGKSYDLPRNDAKVISPQDLTVSPDHNWLAYLGAVTSSSIEYSLIVQSADGQQRLSFPHDRNQWDTLFYWLNNQWLVLVKHNSGLDTLVLFNPFTEEKQILPPKYPDLLQNDQEWWNWPTITVYDPTMERVVYVGYTQETGQKLVFWDRQANEAVLELPHLGYTYDPPLWSPDGKEFIFVKSPETLPPNRWDEEIIQVSWDGKVSQLTHLSDFYEHTKIDSYSWSPNGKYLAFWLWTGIKGESYNRAELTVLDVTNRSVTNYCISTEINVPQTPIWSPNNQQLAIEVVTLDNSINSILVDIAKKYAAQITKDVTPLGWMVSNKQ